ILPVTLLLRCMILLLVIIFFNTIIRHQTRSTLFPYTTLFRSTFSDIRWSNYLEYDFSKKKHDEFGNPIIKSHQSFYVGIGGYIGIAPNTSKTLTYIKDGEKYRESTWSRFNSERFMYGVGAYVGYKAFSIRASYNLNNNFKKSFADQNMFNVSLVLSLI